MLYSRHSGADSREWVKFGKGKDDKFRNPRTAGGFVINSTELRAVNFTMEPIDKPPVRPRTTGPAVRPL